MPAKRRGVLLDVEGTTTPISFVYEVLFPFAAARLDEACARAAASEPLERAVAALRREHEEEKAAGAADLPAFGDGAPFARYLMERDRKSPGLKTLQGLIWRRGYESGELRGVVFDDVPEALRRWREAGHRLRVFSSGSVLAQKLLFSTTEHGDLTVFFEGFHDTGAGPKKEASSYLAIADAFALPPAEILFLSDVVDELDAAAAAGMATGLARRPGNKPADAHGHSPHRSFQELDAVLGI
jgi:enolase-phosphatase E1